MRGSFSLDPASSAGGRQGCFQTSGDTHRRHPGHRAGIHAAVALYREGHIRRQLAVPLQKTYPPLQNPPHTNSHAYVTGCWWTVRQLVVGWAGLLWEVTYFAAGPWRLPKRRECWGGRMRGQTRGRQHCRHFSASNVVHSVFWTLAIASYKNARARRQPMPKKL